MFQRLLDETWISLPYSGWAILGLIVLVAHLIRPQMYVSAVLTVIGLIVLLALSALSLSMDTKLELFNGVMVMDSLGQMLNLITIGITLAVVLMLLAGYEQVKGSSGKLFEVSYQNFPELLMTLLFSGFGVSVLVSATDLTSLFLGLESLSIGVYCLCGFYRTELKSIEAAFKYLLIGAFSTAIFLYGVALVYGAAGSTSYSEIFAVARERGLNELFVLGGLFMTVGFSFKMALVPFHLYTPDVYEGAPTPITAYMATVIKLAAVGAGVRLFWGVLEPVSRSWELYWTALCALSILVGNVMALQQASLKKMLAFSGIAHAGFMGLALLVAKPGVGTTFPLLAYVFVYSAMSVGLFALICYVEDRARVFKVEHLRGFARKRLGLAICLGILVLGLAGIPPFGGFLIKFWVLQALVQQGYLTVAVLAVIGSVIGAAYYLKILLYVFISEEEGSWAPGFDRSYALRAVVAVGVLVTIFATLRPQFYADWILSALALK